MVEYVGYKDFGYSHKLQEEVSVLKYKIDLPIGFAYCDCDVCGKPIRRFMYVVQSKETDIELLHLGSECIKRLQ